jgi:hypothetical protein
VEISKLDSPRIRGRDLLNHAAGFVTDDPWGDRQTPLPELEFVRLLRDGVTFARTPATAMEYSNLGFALLGRALSVSHQGVAAGEIAGLTLQPSNMTSPAGIDLVSDGEMSKITYQAVRN